MTQPPVARLARIDSRCAVHVQGMLPLTFANPSDYDKVGPRDKLDIKGLPPRELT